MYYKMDTTNTPSMQNVCNDDVGVSPSVSVPRVSKPAPPEPCGDSASFDDTGDMQKIIICYKDTKLEMHKLANGTWTRLTKKRPKYLGRRVGNARTYAEALRRKKKRGSTAFGRLRIKHMRSMQSRSFRNANPY